MSYKPYFSITKLIKLAPKTELTGRIVYNCQVLPQLK